MDTTSGPPVPAIPGNEGPGQTDEPMSIGQRLGYITGTGSLTHGPPNAAFFGHGDEIDEVDIRPARSIAVLTWGALAWDPRELPLVFERPEEPASAWNEGGPEVPIEFSRVAVDCRLIPVIDPANGVPVPTLWAWSRRNDLKVAVDDLMKVEGARNPKLIGYVDTMDDKHRCLAHTPMGDPVKAWAREHGVHCVIWSELPPNFERHSGRPFSLDAAVKYLATLPRMLAEQAREYVNRAPACIDTPLRRRLTEGGWPGLS